MPRAIVFNPNVKSAGCDKAIARALLGQMQLGSTSRRNDVRVWPSAATSPTIKMTTQILKGQGVGAVGKFSGTFRAGRALLSKTLRGSSGSSRQDSFSVAARQLRVGQPAVSKSIAQIEFPDKLASDFIDISTSSSAVVFCEHPPGSPL